MALALGIREPDGDDNIDSVFQLKRGGAKTAVSGDVAIGRVGIGLMGCSRLLNIRLSVTEPFEPPGQPMFVKVLVNGATAAWLGTVVVECDPAPRRKVFLKKP